MKTIMDESGYKELLRESISFQWDKFGYFRHICKRKNRSLEDIITAINDEEYYQIPAVTATAFKKSKGLYKELNDLTQSGKFQVSSNTSGDPSYVYTNNSELEKVTENYRLTFGIEGTSRAIGFSPSLRIMEGLSKKSAFMGYESTARMKLSLDAAKKFYENIVFTLDVDLFRTLISKVFNGKAVLRIKHLNEIVDIISAAEKTHEKINLGGFILLLYPYLDQLREGQFCFPDNACFTFAGGGYGGTKGAITGKKVDKPEMIKKIASIFGLRKELFSKNLKDIYAFTESPATNEGYWSDELQDYLFESWHETRAYIVDPETEKPLKSGKGLLKFISPYSNGTPSACNVSILQLDYATIRGLRPDYTVSHFSHIERFRNASTEGCAYKAEEVANI